MRRTSRPKVICRQIERHDQAQGGRFPAAGVKGLEFGRIPIRVEFLNDDWEKLRSCILLTTSWQHLFHYLVTSFDPKKVGGGVMWRQGRNPLLLHVTGASQITSFWISPAMFSETIEPGNGVKIY